MKIEDQVCSLGLAKRLKKLGVKQRGLFFWKTDAGDHYFVAHNSRYMDSNGIIEAAAFTVAELGELLPDSYKDIDGVWWYIGFCKHVDGRQIITTHHLNGSHEIAMSARVEADARAKMLIYLLENKLA